MTALLKKHGVILISVVAVAILATTWFANGSESEDAWLYISAIGIALIPVFEMFYKKMS
jgi:hypothetical protein